MSNIDKHALRGQSVEGSYYLVECCNCGEMYPSNLLDGGEAIADSGDYGDCYCHLCGADDTERADWGDVNSNEAKAWNFQQKRIEALMDELEAKDQRIAELSALQGKPIAWESTNPVYVKFITDERYQRLRPGYKKWYKPYRCSQCAAAGKGE